MTDSFEKPAPFSLTAKNGDVYSRHPAGPWTRNGVVTISDERWVSLLDALEEAAS